MQITIQQGPFVSPLHGGEYFATGPSGLFPAWCAEQTQALRFGEIIDYQVVDGIEAWGSLISDALDLLMSWTVGSVWPTTLDQNDAIQSDIWSILSGHAGMIDATATPITQHASLLHNSTRQDLLVSAEIGEPEPASLLLFGVVAILLAKKAAR